MEARTPLLCIGIPTLCCGDLLEPVVPKLAAQLASPERIIIVDNGRQPQLAKLKGNTIHVHRPEENLGVAASWNWMLDHAFGIPSIEWLLLLNDDIELARNQVSKIREELRIASEEGRWLVQGPFEWSVFAIKRDCIEAVGWFDEKFFPGYCEDIDYKYRLQLRDPRRLKQAFQSFEPAVKRHQTTGKRCSFLDFSRSWSYYEEKWGGPCGKEQFRTPFNR